MTAVLLGDMVEIESEDHRGVVGQVWETPDAGFVVVATGSQFVKVRDTSVKVLERTLPERRLVDRTSKLVKARKPHSCGCDSGHYADEHRCIGIKPGQQYVRSALFPGDINSHPFPLVKKLCLVCARQYDDTDPARLAVAS